MRIDFDLIRKKKLKKFLPPGLHRFYAIIRGERSIFDKSLLKKVKGNGNKINIHRTARLLNLKININGNCNSVTIDQMCVINNAVIYILGDNNDIKIGRNVRFNNGGSLWMDDNDCKIVIEPNTTFEDCNLALPEPGTSIIIGEDCMFAYDIDLRTGDSHSVQNAQTKMKLNPGKDITIGSHVWISSHVSILKGVTLADDTVVATRSLVTKSFTDKGVIVGGNPASIIKRDITWSRDR